MVSKEWFEEWFDTTYYHTLYKNRNDEEAAEFIRNLITFLDLEKDSNVLDLACGKGRHSVTLNELGFEVLGVDLSSNSIQLAKEHTNNSLHFAVHDMREILHEEKKFKVVFNLFTSFGYFDSITENQKIIQSVYEMLDDKGYFVIDFMNATKVIEHLVEKENKIVDGITFDLERKYDGQHIFKDIRFEDEGQNFHFTERVQALKEADFIQLLTANKFDIIRTFGDFSLNKFDEKTSDRLIIIAKKI
jgi:cyclopropane fatty-acyl-phospholipid synthase-like methyltransferase